MAVCRVKRTWLSRAVFVWWAILIVGCRTPFGASRPIPQGAYAGANVILIELNPLRWDHVGLYGSSRGLTPMLDAFSSNAIRFEQAIAVAPWCVPGKLAMWTGLYPTTHGMHNKLMTSASGEVVPAVLSSTIPTYPEALKAAGYAVVGFTGDAGVAGSFGFNRGFDRYVDDREFGGLDYAAPLAIEWLKTHTQQRFFLWLNGYDAHWHYEPPGGYQKRFCATYRGRLTGRVEERKLLDDRILETRFTKDAPSGLGFSSEDKAFYEALYDEKVQDADARLGRFLKSLDELGLTKNTIVVMFSGGGDEYFDHGFLGHGLTLYEEILHVPLLMRLPDRDAQQAISQQVRLFDVFPTLFDLLGIRFDHPVQGVSLLPALNGQPLGLEAMAETRFRLSTHQYALRTADSHYKLIYSQAPSKRVELYDLWKDPHEQDNIAAKQPRLTDELEQRLFQIIRLAQESGQAAQAQAASHRMYEHGS